MISTFQSYNDLIQYLSTERVIFSIPDEYQVLPVSRDLRTISHVIKKLHSPLLKSETKQRRYHNRMRMNKLTVPAAPPNSRRESFSVEQEDKQLSDEVQAMSILVSMSAYLRQVKTNKQPTTEILTELYRLFSNFLCDLSSSTNMFKVALENTLCIDVSGISNRADVVLLLFTAQMFREVRIQNILQHSLMQKILQKTARTNTDFYQQILNLFFDETLMSDCAFSKAVTQALGAMLYILITQQLGLFSIAHNPNC